MPATDAPELLTTSRLRLTPLAAADVAEVHAIYADPATWLHLPAGRHTALAQAERVVEESEQSWAASGLGRWAIRLRHDLPGTALTAGTLIGVASAMLMDCGARNFGYRLTPASWGIGLATEAATVTLAAAQDSPYPVTARALANNPASVRVLERIGLTRVWRGKGVPGSTPDETTPAATPMPLPARVPMPTNVVTPGHPDAGTPGSPDTAAPGHPDTTAPRQPDSTALERHIFADRPLPPELLAAIIRLG